MKIPVRYVPTKITEKDKQKQVKNVNKIKEVI